MCTFNMSKIPNYTKYNFILNPELTKFPIIVFDIMNRETKLGRLFMDIVTDDLEYDFYLANLLLASKFVESTKKLEIEVQKQKQIFLETVSKINV